MMRIMEKQEKWKSRKKIQQKVLRSNALRVLLIFKTFTKNHKKTELNNTVCILQSENDGKVSSSMI